MKIGRNNLVLTVALVGLCIGTPRATSEEVRNLDLPGLLTMVANSGTANQDPLQNGLSAIALTAPPKIRAAKRPSLP